MSFSLEFDPRALKEWDKLGDTLRQQFKKKLTEVLAKRQLIWKRTVSTKWVRPPRSVLARSGLLILKLASIRGLAH